MERSELCPALGECDLSLKEALSCREVGVEVCPGFKGVPCCLLATEFGVASCDDGRLFRDVLGSWMARFTGVDSTGIFGLAMDSQIDCVGVLGDGSRAGRGYCCIIFIVLDFFALGTLFVR